MQFIDVISRTQLCRQLGISRSTIKRWIKTRNFPEPLEASGREPLFYLTEVEKWFSEMGASND